MARPVGVSFTDCYGGDAPEAGSGKERVMNKKAIAGCAAAVLLAFVAGRVSRGAQDPRSRAELRHV